ncbi:MAG: GNAT family N-acetyltransferase [Pseudorhodoplanes sp.]|nr:GNAT family N-acetyltransferase [Pseudorhodoplanes sp.]
MRRLLARLLGGRDPVLSQASMRDSGALAALHAHSFHRGWSEEEFERLLADRGVLAHRAMIGRRLCGFIISHMVEAEAEILSVAVSQRHRGSGIGRLLLALHLGRLTALGIKVVFLEVDEANEPARRLYRRAGFHEVGRRSGYYAGPRGATSALVLRRDLV